MKERLSVLNSVLMVQQMFVAFPLIQTSCSHALLCVNSIPLLLAFLTAKQQIASCTVLFSSHLCYLLTTKNHLVFFESHPVPAESSESRAQQLAVPSDGEAGRRYRGRVGALVPS